MPPPGPLYQLPARPLLAAVRAPAQRCGTGSTASAWGPLLPACAVPEAGGGVAVRCNSSLSSTRKSSSTLLSAVCFLRMQR